MVLELRKRARHLSIRKPHLRITCNNIVKASKYKKRAIFMQIGALFLREKNQILAQRFAFAAQVYLVL
jgi:hypothetical protein